MKIYIQTSIGVSGFPANLFIGYPVDQGKDDFKFAIKLGWDRLKGNAGIIVG